ncbi:MAG: DUF192 domain-containing protein [Sphingomonas sp.]
MAPAMALSLLTTAACTPGDAALTADADGGTTRKVALTVTSSNGAHNFNVELASTKAEQARGLMFRTSIPANGGMLFAPHPPQGGAPTEASFWMKDTPSPLDIIFIRADGSIARIAENTTPFSEMPIPSGEPVSAILELRGGRSVELGIAPDDKVEWAGHPNP